MLGVEGKEGREAGMSEGARRCVGWREGGRKGEGESSVGVRGCRVHSYCVALIKLTFLRHLFRAVSSFPFLVVPFINHTNHCKRVLHSRLAH